ncbi:MAG: diadenylate cyclase [Candidatus Paceibacterota bacterium]|jgi:uncharacterized protein (TIGR00159 family)
MTNFYNYFLHVITLIEPKDFLDVAIVAGLIYVVMIFVRQTRTYLVFYALALLAGIYFLSTRFDLGLTRQIFQPILTFSFFLLAIVFQRDLRRFFDWFFISGRKLVWERKKALTNEVSISVTKAIGIMAKNKIGALIVFPGDYPLDSLIEGGWGLDGRISSTLLLSIFDHHSPGHDGAVIIENNRLRRFGVHLPLAENYQGWHQAGTRHRAGVGITERSDALSVIVSEERGEISVAENGKLRKISSIDELNPIIADHLKESIHLTTGFWHYFLARNTWVKLTAIVLAGFFWFILAFSGGTVTQTIDVPIETRLLTNNLQVEQVNPQDVKVTVTGSDRDLRNFDSRQIKATIDLTEAQVGWQEYQITKDSISYPSYLKLIKISPETVKITIHKNVENN